MKAKKSAQHQPIYTQTGITEPGVTWRCQMSTTEKFLRHLEILVGTLCTPKCWACAPPARDNTIRSPPLQPFYNSGTTGPIETKMKPFESKDTISPAVSKMVTSNHLGDLQRSTLCFRLLQPFYNSGTTGPIETKMPPVDSAYAISSAVSKMVTSGDLGDLQRSTLRFRPLQPFYYSGTTGPIETKMPPVDSAYAISSAVSKMVTSGDLGDLQRST